MQAYFLMLSRYITPIRNIFLQLVSYRNVLISISISRELLYMGSTAFALNAFTSLFAIAKLCRRVFTHRTQINSIRKSNILSGGFSLRKGSVFVTRYCFFFFFTNAFHFVEKTPGADICFC